MKLNKLVAGLGVALSCFCGMAQATVIAFQDDDLDFLLDANLQPKLAGAFTPGDILVSVFEMPTYTIGGVNAIPAGQELTGVAAIRLVGGNGTVATPYVFAPTLQGLNAFLPGPMAVTNGAAGQGATVGMWLNSTADFDLQLDFAANVTTNCTSRAQCIGEAAKGSLVQVDGFGGDADNFWIAKILTLGGDDPSVVKGVGGSNGVATFNAGLTTFFNVSGPIEFMDIVTGLPCPAGTVAADGCIQGPTVSGGISGGLGLNPALYTDGAFARSDIDAQKLQAVPEPGTLAIAGLALLGLAATRRRVR